jgi:TP901 family phage tail tape measure protein
MADETSVIELIFKGVDQASAVSKAVSSSTQQLASDVKGATQPFADLATGAVELEAKLLAAGIAVTGLSIKLAGDFDGAFREIATLIDEPIESLGEFRQSILDYASSSTQSLDQVTRAIYSAISADVDYKDSIQAVSVAEKLAVAGKADLNDSLVVLVSSLNAYGLGMDSAERFSDALFTAVKKGQITLPELSASLADVTGTAAQLEIPFETLLSSIAALTSGGAPVSKAVTQISAALSAMLGPAPQAAAEAERLGIQFDATAVKSRGFEGVLLDVARATDGDEASLKKLFGSIEAVRGVLPLIGAQADKFGENLDAMANKTGQVQVAFDKMAGSFSNTNQKIQNSLNTLFINLGDPILDEYGSIGNAIAKIFDELGASVDEGALKDIVKFVEDQMGNLAKALDTVGKNLPAALNQADLSGFTDGLGAISEAVGLLFDGVDLTTAEGLASAITAIGAAFEGLSEFTGGVIKSFKPLFDEVTKTASAMLKLDSSVFETAGKVAGFAKQANLLADAFLALAPVVQTVLTLLAVKQAGGMIKALGAASDAAGGLGAALGKGGLVAVAAAAGLAIGTLANKIAELTTGTSISTFITDLAISAGWLDSEADELARKLEQTTPAIKGVGSAAKSSSQDAKAAAAALKELGDSASDATDGQSKAAKTQGDLNKSLGEGVELIDIYTGNVLFQEDRMKNLIRLTEDQIASNENHTGTLSIVKNEFSEAAQKARGYGDALENISSEEKLALIEAQATITAAALDASAEQTVAAFESVDNAINTTADSVLGLFGLLGDDSISKFDKLGIKEQIEKENRRQEENFENQQKLISAQTRYLNAQTEFFRRGDAVITVQADGLEPELNAIWHQILGGVQLRVNAEGFPLLMGI